MLIWLGPVISDAELAILARGGGAGVSVAQPALAVCDQLVDDHPNVVVARVRGERAPCLFASQFLVVALPGTGIGGQP